MAQVHGIIPPTTTPFTADGEIDFVAARAQVCWMIGRGVHGIASGGPTGEGHSLDADAFRRLDRRHGGGRRSPEGELQTRMTPE